MTVHQPSSELFAAVNEEPGVTVGLDLVIEGGTKVGIVGRRGSGSELNIHGEAEASAGGSPLLGHCLAP